MNRGVENGLNGFQKKMVQLWLWSTWLSHYRAPKIYFTIKANVILINCELVNYNKNLLYYKNQTKDKGAQYSDNHLYINISMVLLLVSIYWSDEIIVNPLFICSGNRPLYFMLCRSEG